MYETFGRLPSTGSRLRRSFTSYGPRFAILLQGLSTKGMHYANARCGIDDGSLRGPGRGSGQEGREEGLQGHGGPTGKGVQGRCRGRQEEIWREPGTGNP